MAEIKYVTSAAFRNSFVDDKGEPLINGYLYSWKDLDHNCPKPIYKSNIITAPAQTPPEYPNPIELDSGGSVPPPSALFFADDEQYYLELRESDDVTVVQTEEKWPPETVGPTPPTDELDVTNFIGNSDFTEQLRGEFLTGDLTASAIKIAPPKWHYIRSNVTATTTITFEKMLLGQTDVPDNPYAQLHYQCSGAGTGETTSDIFYNIDDVRSFEGKEISIGFYGYTPSAGTVTIILRQNFGGSGSTAVDKIVGTSVLTADWAAYTFSTTVPSISGKVIDPERGALQIIFRMTLNDVSQAILTRFQLNKGDVILEYQYLPENLATGKNFNIEAPPKPSQRYFDANGLELYYDWTLVYASTTGYNWEASEVVGGGKDWFTEVIPKGWVQAERNIHLKASFPRLFAALGNRYGSLYTTASVVADLVTVTNKANGNVTDATAGTTSFIATTTQQGTAVLPEIYTFQCTAASLINPGDYVTFSTPSKDFVAWFTIDNSGSAPVVGATEKVHIPLVGDEDPNEVAAILRDLLNPTAFYLPDGRGTFWRGWDHGAGVDPDAATRTDRGDGTTGDNVGTKQTDELKSHAHNLFVDDQANAGSGQLTIAGTISAPTTDVTGGLETRPINTYVMRIIKY